MTRHLRAAPRVAAVASTSTTAELNYPYPDADRGRAPAISCRRVRRGACGLPGVRPTGVRHLPEPAEFIAIGRGSRPTDLPEGMAFGTHRRSWTGPGALAGHDRASDVDRRLPAGVQGDVLRARRRAGGTPGPGPAAGGDRADLRRVAGPAGARRAAGRRATDRPAAASGGPHPDRGRGAAEGAGRDGEVPLVPGAQEARRAAGPPARRIRLTRHPPLVGPGRA